MTVPEFPQTASCRQVTEGKVANTLLWIAIVACAYLASARLGFLFSAQTKQVTAIWPPTGIALAALLLRGPRVWPGIFLGAIVSNAWNHETIYTAAGIAAGNTLGPLLGAYCLRRFVQFDVSLGRLRDVLGLAVFGSALAMMVTATNGVANLALASIIPWSAAPSTWVTWWVGDAMGALLVAPPILTWFTARHFEWSVPKLIELIVAVSVLTVIAAISFSASFPLAYPIFPPVIWIALRFGPREAAVAVLTVSAATVWRTSFGGGPFSSGSMDIRLGMLVTFLAVLAITALVLAALAAERRRADASLRHAKDELEDRVIARTVALAQSEERFRGAFDNAAHGFALLALDGRWLRVNAALCHMLGYTEDELLTTDFQAITHPDDLDADLAHVASLLAGEIQTYQMEKRYFHKNGEIVSALLSVSLVRTDDGSPLQFVSQIINITDRKLVEEALRRSEEQYRLLASNATDTVFRLDLEGNCLYVSPSSRDLIGFDPEYLIGKYVLTRFHPDDTQEVIDKHRALANGECERLIVTYRSEPADRPGTWVWLESNCGLVRDPVTNAPREIIASLRDISERKTLEFQLEAARREAEEATLAKSRFLSNISHEIKTPMSGILGMIELLRGTTSARDEAQLLDGLDQSAQMLTTILNDILDYSKMESDHLVLEEVDLDFQALLRSTFQLFAASASNDQRSLSFSFPQECSPIVRGDPARLRQIIANLLSNAVKFTPEGHIKFTVSCVAEESSQRTWRVEVIDTGIGIDTEKIDAVFSPFVQGDVSTTRRFGGTGLGLAICRRLVEAMGGKIGAESTPGRGSLFWIEVALAEPRSMLTAEINKQATALNALAAPSLHILLAEDHPINQQLVGELVHRMGHRLTCASNGRAAVEAFAAGRFDLVLMDMQMPEMDGPEAASAIRSLGDKAARIPIVALSADESAQSSSNYHTAKFDAFLSKPISAAKLSGVLAGIRFAEGAECDQVDVSQTSLVPVLDTTTLSQLSETLGPVQVDQLLCMLSADVGCRTLAIKDMVGRGESLEARRNAHSLRGAALPLGAMRLAEAARLLELDIADSRRNAEELVFAADETVRAISCYRLEQQAPHTSDSTMG